MKKSRDIASSLKSAAIIATALVVPALSASAGSSGFDADAKAAKPNAEISYQYINKAIRMGAAWGNRAKGAHGTFGIFPPKFITPIHIHSGAYHGIVVSGQMTNPFGAKGESNPKKMGSGSYWYVPAGMPHSTACLSATPCVFYFHAERSFDFKPVK